MYVINAKNSRKKVGKKVEKGKIEHKICMALIGLRRNRRGQLGINELLQQSHQVANFELLDYLQVSQFLPKLSDRP